MTQSARDGADAPLLALDEPELFGSLIETQGVETLAALANAPERVLWIQGDGGTGKTTAICRALRDARGGNATRRIVCHPGMRIEEALFGIADFLRQLGDGSFSAALHQRCSLTAKISVLFDTLRETPVTIWLDDLHRIPSGARETEPLSAFLAAARTLEEGSAGRLVISSRKGPPPGSGFLAVELPPWTQEDARALWSALADSSASGDSSYPDAGFATELETRPLAVRLLRGLVDRGVALGPFLATSATPDVFELLVDESYEALSPEARRILTATVAFGRPLTRFAMRSMTEAAGLQLEGDGTNDARICELARAAWLERVDPISNAPPSYRAHPALARSVAFRAKRENAGTWTQLLVDAAGYFLQVSASTESWWPICAARELYYHAGRYDEACQLQKVFLEDLLRLGFFDLASSVLHETVETTTGNTRAVALGNLAIIYKNAAEHDKALEIYEEVRRDLETIGDRANLARVLHQIGNVHYLRDEFERALERYRESAEISEELGETTITAATRVQIANVLYQSGRDAEALTHYEAVLERLTSHGAPNPSLVSAVGIQIGQIHQRAKRFAEAEQSLAAAESVTRASGDRRGLIKALRAKAMLARERRDVDQARTTYDEAERIAIELGDQLEAITCRLLRGDLERDRMQLGTALDAYCEARERLATAAARSTVSPEQLQAGQALLETRFAELREVMGAVAFDRALKGRDVGAGAGPG